MAKVHDQESTILAAKFRRPVKFWKLVSVLFPVGGLTLVILYMFHLRPFGILVIDISYIYLLMAFFLPLVFVWVPATSKSPRDHVPWYDILLILIIFAIPTYFAAHQLDIQQQAWGVIAPPLPAVLASMLWVLVLEAARRAADPIFALVVLVFSVYPLFASYMPGLLEGPSFTFRQLASYHGIGAEGIAGTPMNVFGRVVVGYLFYAASVQAVGAGKFFTDVAAALLRNTRAANAKVAIVASALFGTISGSGVANVFVTGTFTIPAMKKEGIPPEFAAGVEATASTGGAFTPPVMAGTAFLLAEFAKVSYADVCIVAAVPAALYYVCLFAQIDSYAARIGIKPPPAVAEVPPIGKTLLANFHIILSFLLLVYMVFFLRLVNWAPWFASALAVVLAFYRKEKRHNISGFFVRLLQDSGRVMCQLVGMLAPVGMIIGSFVVTGVAFSFPHEIVLLAGGNIWVMLFFGFIAAFILGLGLPLIACYIFLAIVLVPALLQFGIDLMAAHFFVMYCGVLSDITPPVCYSAFAAASIAESDPMKTGFQAMKLGVAKYILPFVFVISPALILRGSAIDSLRVIPCALVALIIISGALEGYFWFMGTLTKLGRLLLLAAGLLLAFPHVTTELYGASLFVAIFGLSFLLRWVKSPLAGLIIKSPRSETVGNN